MRQTTEIKVYWDIQDPDNEGWAYRFSDQNGDIDSGPLSADSNNLDDAIEEAISISGHNLTVDLFAREPNMDGGYAVWTAE